MGFRMYKSVRVGKGVRVNLSKTGIGMSAGGGGVTYSVHSSGRTTRTVGVPGSGVSYRSTSGGGGRRPSASRSRSQPVAPAPVYPRAGLFAPKRDKAFVKGVTAYMQGQHAAALNFLNQARSLNAGEDAVAEEYFLGFTMVALEDTDGAIKMLESVLASDAELPDQLMIKYGIGGYAQISVTPQVVAEVPQGSLAAALLLAELYQQAGEPKLAIEILESLGAIAPNVFFALSLADLFEQTGSWDDLLRVSEDFVQNEDDATCQLLAYRGKALREKGLHEASLQVLKEALKSKKRDSLILDQARYERALTYEAAAKKALARKEWERLYAANPDYPGVAERLGLSGSRRSS